MAALGCGCGAIPGRCRPSGMQRRTGVAMLPALLTFQLSSVPGRDRIHPSPSASPASPSFAGGLARGPPGPPAPARAALAPQKRVGLSRYLSSHHLHPATKPLSSPLPPAALPRLIPPLNPSATQAKPPGPETPRPILPSPCRREEDQLHASPTAAPTDRCRCGSRSRSSSTRR